MTTEFQTRGNSYATVDVPASAFGFEILFGNELSFWTSHFVRENIILPPGKWEPIGQAHSLTEEQWREIVDGKKNVMVDWDIIEGDIMGDVFENYEGEIYFHTAKESGQSLLAHYKIKSTAVILKK